MKLGVIGAGLVASAAHLPMLRELDGLFDVVAIADPAAQARGRIARRFGIPGEYPDHRALLGGERPDAVLVCSPNDTHAQIVLDALEAGVHVFVEKPMCITLADADRIIAARDRTGLVVQVGYMKRFDPAFEALLDDVRPGLRHVSTATYDPGLAGYFGGERSGGDALDDASVFSERFAGALIHDVNLVHGVLEHIGALVPCPVLDASCTAGGDVVTGVVGLPDGGRWTMVWQRLPGLADFREEIVVYARDSIRRLDFPAPYLLRSPTRYVRVADGEQRARGDWSEPYARQLEHFHDCVTTGVPCRTPPEQARVDLELLTDLFRMHLQRLETA